MSRIITVWVLAALLGACGTARADYQSDWQQAQLACAYVGISPSSGAFGDCVADLYESLSNEEYESGR